LKKTAAPTLKKTAAPTLKPFKPTRNPTRSSKP
jgi:hypothetical protein